MKILFISRAYSEPPQTKACGFFGGETTHRRPLLRPFIPKLKSGAFWCRGKSSGGMERFSYDLIQAASSHPSLTTNHLTHNGPRNTSPLFVFLIIPKAIFVARNYDAIHIGDPILAIVGWLTKLILRKKIIVTVHGLDISYPNALYQLYLRLFFRSFDLYLPISKAVNKKLAKLSVKGKVTTINPGISKDYYDSSLTRAQLSKVILEKNTNPLPPASLSLLTTGRLVKRKGHAWFITNVLPRLPSHVHYIIAGDGPEKENLKKIIDEQQLQKRVHILGRVSSHDLKILYNTSDAFIQPNIKVDGDIEGFGLVLLEAALCNKPVFAADLEGMTDAIIPGHNGTLLPTENSDAWIDTLNSFIATPSQITEARTFTLENYSWQSYVSKLLQTLKDI